MDFDVFCGKVSAPGFDGVEMNLSSDDEERNRQLRTLNAHGLELIAQHSQTRCADFKEHLRDYTKHVTRIAEEDSLLINTHTGRDWYSFEQNLEIIEAAERIAEKRGKRIVHETHRGRFSFCAAVTRRFLEAVPSLRLCTDLSHWCTVSESFLEDQQLAVDAAIRRTDQIHARIGCDQGPQVSDPRAPEWQNALQTFMGWWDKIVECHEEKGSAVLPITTEFGPPPYMPVLPRTQQSAASQWDLNIHMLELLQHRYNKK